MNQKRPTFIRADQYLLLSIKDELVALRELVLEQKLLVGILIAGLTALFFAIGHITTKEIVLAADQKGSSWYQIAQNASKYVEANGLNYSIRTSNGTIENAQLLEDPDSGVNVAFLIPGALDPKVNASFYSLGSLDYEPIWIFYHKKIGHISNLRDFAKYKVGVGPTESGRYVITEKIFALNKVETANNPNFIPNTISNQIIDFNNDKLDILIFIGQAYDKNARKLANDPNVVLYDFDEADAYTKIIPFLQKVSVPAGSFDIGNRIPNKPLSLIAITTTLAVRKDTDQNLQLAILMAAKDAERSAENLFFAKRNEFPTYMDPLIELSPVAKRFYDFGPPALLNYFPFWAATLLDRFSVLLVAILAILFPVVNLTRHLRDIRANIVQTNIYSELVEINRQVSNVKLTLEELEQIQKKLKQLDFERANDSVKIGKESQYFSFSATISSLLYKVDKQIEARKSSP